MSCSINIHPENHTKWDFIGFDVYGPEGGNALILHLDCSSIVIHFGDVNSRYEFIKKFKDYFGKLENPCPNCGT